MSIRVGVRHDLSHDVYFLPTHPTVVSRLPKTGKNLLLRRPHHVPGDNLSGQGNKMGVMDRDWYRRVWDRKVLGIRREVVDTFSDPALRRRGVVKPRVPRGAEAGNFWRYAYTIAGLLLIAFYVWIHWVRG